MNSSKLQHRCLGLALAIIFAGILPGLCAHASAPTPAGCAQLTAASFSDIEIKEAQPIAAGAFPLPDGWDASSKTALQKLPPFCRVIGVIRPTSDSEIGFELWLPDQWNGRYLQVGNAGFAGIIIYSGLIQGLQNGFAVASTDDGHVGSDTSWMSGHPEKVIDYGYRAVHTTSASAKELLSAYYAKRASYSYFSGCSDGGRESLMEAQRFPDDFDGFIVGAPGNDFVRIMVSLLNELQRTASLTEPLSEAQMKALSAAVLARCDATDGTKDGVIDEPLRCTFDPKELQCKEAPDGRCLSQSQVELIRTIYNDVKEPATGVSFLPGLQGTRGAEAGNWEFPKLSSEGGEPTDNFFDEIVHGFWQKLVFDDPSLDYRKLDLLEALKRGDAYASSIVSSMNPDLSAVRASGKKIIQYHGLADTLPVQYSIGYYEAVEKYLQRDNRDFYRLFLAPGMYHCWNGPGPNVFGGAYTPGGIFDPDHHALAALMQWVEKGKAPDRIIATKYQDDNQTKATLRTRPLCPYPQVTQWTGSGSTDDAKNFKCASETGVTRH